jgi:phosphate transport system permease protein
MKKIKYIFSVDAAIQDRRFKKTIHWLAWFIVILLVLIFLTLLKDSFFALRSNGLGFLFGTVWDPIFDEYGVKPVLVGTLLTSFLALILSLPFSIAIALFFGEYFREGRAVSLLKSAIELLAGIPSVIYGFIALIVLVPLVRSLELSLRVIPLGVGILSASIVLAIMIIPYAASIAREVIQLVPQDIKEAAYALGATRYEVIKKVIIPYASSGILAGILLALGRAIGETMAVTMVIGNATKIPSSIFDTGNTMASLIANELAEATKQIYVSSLIEVALLLFIVSAIINIIGKLIIKKVKV